MIELTSNDKLLLSVCLALFVMLVFIHMTNKYIAAVGKRKDFLDMLNDLEYLLALEELHCREHSETTGMSKKNTMRQALKTERGLVWSGKFTNSTLAKLKEQEQRRYARWIAPLEKFNFLGIFKMLKP